LAANGRLGNGATSGNQVGPSAIGSASTPADPSNLLTTSGLDMQVALSWTAGARADEYELQYRLVGAGSWTSAGLTSAAHTVGLISGLTGWSTYEFQVRAHNAAGYSAWIPTTPATATPQSAPAGLIATSGQDGQVPLSWTSAGAAATRYTVRYRIGAGSWTTLESVTNTSMTVTGLANGTTYGFEVSGGNADGDSAWSAEVTANTVATGSPTVGNSQGGFNNSTSAASFTVTKPTGLADGDLLVAEVVTINTATGVAVSNGTWSAGPVVASSVNSKIWTFYKKITNAAGEPASYTMSWTGNQRGAGGLIAVSGASTVDPQIETSSTNGSAGAGSTTASMASLTTSGANRLLLNLHGIDGKSTYSSLTGFSAIDVNQNTGNGGGNHYTALAGHVTQAGAGASPSMSYNYGTAIPWETVLLAIRPPSAPAAPTGLAATGGRYAYVPLSWSSVTGASDYQVRYRVNGTSPWTQGAWQTATSADISGLTNATTYEFQVKSRAGGLESAWSASVTATPSASGLPQPPTGVSATGFQDTQIPVSWTAVAGATSYTVQYRVQGAGSWTARSAVAGTSDTITGLTNGTTYEVQVKASNSAGDSAWAPGTPLTAVPQRWAQISGGRIHTCAVTSTGKAYCWGNNASGQLGTGATGANQASPVAVDTTTGLTDTNVAKISAGNDYTCAVTTAGRAYCWGANSSGQLGTGSGSATSSPTAVDTSTGLTTTNVAQISAGQAHTCAVTTAGRAYCFGDDGLGQLGNGATTGTQLSPSAVDTTTGLTTTNVASITANGQEATCAVTTAGRAYCWGADSYAELGNGATSTMQASPAAVDTTTGLTTTNVASIALGAYHACAVTTAGRAYCWGTDTNGQLGNGSGTTADQASPSAVDTSTGLTTTNVASISGGNGQTCALTTTGQAYCWGTDSNGQVGNGATTGNQASPSAVDTSTGLTTTNVAKLSAGNDHTCAVTTTGRAFCWGWDNYGELGNGGTLTADQVSPSSIG
jgi:alpha-tubulin suppressor-like RCC1 family protein